MIMHNPAHPGKILRNYTDATGLSVTQIAEKIRISRKVLSQILNGHAGISAEMAWKLSAAFGTSPDLWINLQKQYDLWQAKQRVDVSDIEQLLKPAA
ncbi:HigA family addiction module antitoxin [Botryobacter ruber]|uniref:HigA family addiction module antitoxin n=1 Tax=Botryobacter ruber TaxID=2171629 RepID=UPI000E0AB769|nr:HigA family addiction module antitoxin [Botryobacter ruber]